MNTTRLLFLITIILISGCRGCNDQTDKVTNADTIVVSDPDTLNTPDTFSRSSETVVTKPESKDTAVKQPAPAVIQPAPAETRSADLQPKKDPGVLARIDDYLVSTPKFTVGANGGISQATVSVTNKLPKASFQKLILEVTILNSDNSLVTSDYYNMVNLEPGETKLVNIRDNPKGSKIVVHVVKVRSTELTNGESVVTGARYNPQ